MIFDLTNIKYRENRLFKAVFDVYGALFRFVLTFLRTRVNIYTLFIL